MSWEGWVLQGGQQRVVVGIVVAFVRHADSVGQSCQTRSSILNIQKIHRVVLVVVIVVWMTLSVVGGICVVGSGVVLVIVIVVWTTLSVVGGICVVGADAAPICSQPKARNALVLAVWGPKSKGSLVLLCRGHQAWFVELVVPSQLAVGAAVGGFLVCIC